MWGSSAADNGADWEIRPEEEGGEMATACMEIHKALVNVIYVTLKTSGYNVGGQWAEEVTTKLDPLHRHSKGNASVRHLPGILWDWKSDLSVLVQWWPIVSQGLVGFNLH